jgi:hypothetical protein
LLLLVGGINAFNFKGFTMASILQPNRSVATPKSLRLSHDQARAEFVRATTEGGRVGIAAKRLADICLPHFEGEERSAFPVLGLLPEITHGSVRPAMLEVLPLIAEFKARREVLEKHHELIQCAIDKLLQACHREKNWEVAEFAYGIRAHEKLEDEVIYPTVILIGTYLRERLHG